MSRKYPRSIPVDFSGLKPEGWYDSCFPTKELHDRWWALANRPAEPPPRGSVDATVNVRVRFKTEE